MAFINSAITAIRPANLASARTCSISGARVAHVAVRSQRASIRMESTKVTYPESEVLGLGKDVPSFLYIFASVVALILGSYCVYKSNIYQPLSAGNLNPQFIVGSLLVPISWGLHVAGFIQRENGK